MPQARSMTRILRLALAGLTAAGLVACNQSAPPNGNTPGAVPSSAPAEDLPEAMVNEYLKGHPATDISFYDKDGKVHKLSEYKGKFIVLTQFAHWCPHCHKQLPRLQGAVAQRLAGKNVVFVNVESSGGSTEDVAAMAKAHGITMPLFTDPQKASTTTFTTFGFPTSYLISPEFLVHGFVSGETDPASFASQVERLLTVTPVPDQP